MNVEDEPEDNITSFVDPSQAVASATKVTTKYMTKYERARILGTRALQIR